LITLAQSDDVCTKVGVSVHRAVSTLRITWNYSVHESRVRCAFITVQKMKHTARKKNDLVNKGCCDKCGLSTSSKSRYDRHVRIKRGGREHALAPPQLRQANTEQSCRVHALSPRRLRQANKRVACIRLRHHNCDKRTRSEGVACMRSHHDECDMNRSSNVPVTLMSAEQWP
jgi:hypothetical protein